MAIRYWVSTRTKHLMHLIANSHRRAGNWGSAMWNHLPRTIQLVSDSQHQAQVCVSPDLGSFHSAISFYCRSQSVVVTWKRHDHGQKEGSGQVKKVVKVYKEKICPHLHTQRGGVLPGPSMWLCRAIPAECSDVVGEIIPSVVWPWPVPTWRSKSRPCLCVSNKEMSHLFVFLTCPLSGELSCPSDQVARSPYCWPAGDGDSRQETGKPIALSILSFVPPDYNGSA